MLARRRGLVPAALPDRASSPVQDRDEEQMRRDLEKAMQASQPAADKSKLGFDATATDTRTANGSGALLQPVRPQVQPAAAAPAPPATTTAAAADALEHPPGFAARRLVVFAGILLG